MQNLYQVDTTGKAYTLDVNPMLAADNKRAAGQIASIQAMGKVADEGFKAVENYNARKQLANLATSVQGLKPGTPEFEQQVASLVFQNPLAFNNPNTANTAKAGLSAMGAAHATAMKEKFQDRQNEFTLRRDQANFDNRVDVARERYKAKNGSPLDVNAALRAIENGEDPSASVGSVEPPQESINSNAESGSTDPMLPEQGDQAQPDDGLLAPVDGAPGEPLPLAPMDEEESLPPYEGAPAPGDSDPVGEEGGKGPAGVEGMPSAAGVVKVPATAKAPTTKGVSTSVDEQIIELHSKAANAENLAALLKSNDQNADALVAASQANKYRAQAKKLEISPEAQAEKRSAALANQKELETAKVAEDAPAIVEALTTQYADLPAGWQSEMTDEFSKVKGLPSLQVKQAYWSNLMASATQAKARGEAIPEKPSDYRKLSLKETTYRTVANELRTAEQDLIKIRVPTQGGNKADAEKAIVAKRAEIDGLKTKVEKAAADVMDFKKEIGLIKPDPVAEAPPAREMTPYEKALSKLETPPAATGDSVILSARDKIAEKYPEVFKKLAEIAKEKPVLESLAISKAVDLLSTGVGGEAGLTGTTKEDRKAKLKDVFGEDYGSNAEEILRGIVQDIRKGGDSIPEVTSQAEAQKLPKGSRFKYKGGVYVVP